TTDEFEQILSLNLSQSTLLHLIDEDLLKPKFERSWSLAESLLQRGNIELALRDQFPDSVLEWHSWLNSNFISNELSDTVAAETGVLPALLGSLWLMFLTILFAFPIGVGAAIYLEEYASDTWLNRIIETNIRNLAGVPSIIYGMLGLAIFVRVLSPITSGAFLGATGDGRSVLSAALTMALLILPLIIINSQEALRAVPSTLREASYGLGATKWQTIWRQVLPAALPGVLTGTILAISRAVGETAPLIVVGVAAYITTNPDGPFSRFTALPRLIYYWTGKPDPQFKNAASAGIIVLLILLLSMNSVAIILRNRASNTRL
ncbi:MAG TPA: phosphate ABC transporter permease PstA, partial [Phototrophicaceae bacterium]|nr:phosphate ABC transporter permease PstA [Phototrophicaceae bacterium]